MDVWMGRGSVDVWMGRGSVDVWVWSGSVNVWVDMGILADLDFLKVLLLALSQVGRVVDGEGET